MCWKVNVQIHVNGVWRQSLWDVNKINEDIKFRPHGDVCGFKRKWRRRRRRRRIRKKSELV